MSGEVAITQPPLGGIQYRFARDTAQFWGTFDFILGGNPDQTFLDYKTVTAAPVQKLPFAATDHGVIWPMFNMVYPLLLVFDRNGQTPTIGRSWLIPFFPDGQYVCSTATIPGLVTFSPGTLFRPPQPLRFEVPPDHTNFSVYFMRNPQTVDQPFIQSPANQNLADGYGSAVLQMFGR